MKQMAIEQQIQESEYIFPYHYISLNSEKHKRLLELYYLSMLRRVCEALKPFNGQRLLDVGCGDGRLCYELKDENVNYTGIDYSSRAIAFARAFNPKSTFQVLSTLELPFENEFDIVTFIEVIEHIPPNDIPVCIENLNKTLKPGGRLVISTPSVNVPVSSKHYQHFTAESLIKLLPGNFELVTKMGHAKAGKYWKRYSKLLKYADLIWPLRNKVPFVKSFLKYVERYYKRIEFCDTEEANTIILIFKKK